MNFAVYFAAMWISEIWYSGFATEKPISKRHAIFCRTMAVVKFDRIINGRIKVEV